MGTKQELQQTISDMVDDYRGILAADESAPTIKKRFDTISAESTKETRRFYRALLLDTEGLGNYISGVILFEETLTQIDDAGKRLPEVAWSQKIVPGIKVDKGKGPLSGALLLFDRYPEQTKLFHHNEMEYHLCKVLNL